MLKFQEFTESYPRQELDTSEIGEISYKVCIYTFLSRGASQEISTLEVFLEKLSEYNSTLKKLGFSMLCCPETNAIFDLFQIIKQNILVESLPELALHYDQLIGESKNKKDGAFYTPIELVEEMLDLIKVDEQNFLQQQILDPACGTGVFLICLIKKIQLEFRDISNGDLLNFVSSYLYGIDINPFVVTCCKLFILLQVFEELSKIPEGSADRLKINVGNSLIIADSLPIESKSPNIAFSNIIADDGFDLILGNPPYGLSRDGQIDSAELEYLKQTYSQEIPGKLNKYLLFMHRSFQLLKKQGQLIFVVPNAWLGINSGRAIRKAVINSGSFAELIIFSEQVFPAANVEAVIFKFIKSAGIESLKVIHKTLPKTAIIREFQIAYDILKSSPENIIPATWSETANKFFLKIDQLTKPLVNKELSFQPAIALQAYSKGKGIPPQTAEQVKNHVFHNKAKLDQNHYPYLEGKDVGRFKISSASSYLNYGPWLSEMQPISRFTGPRVLLREIVGKKPYLFQAVYTEETALYNKSILHIYSKSSENQRTEMLALSAILNSKFASYILLYRGRKTQRKLFPKIVNADLQNFPWVVGAEKQISELAKLSENMHQNPNQELQKQIDRKVYEIYQVESLADEIERELAV